MSGLSIIVRRKRSSYNLDNNMQDRFMLYFENGLLFSAKCQTVTNMSKSRPGDTVAPGPFALRAFVEPRSFYGRIHGICHAHDLEGQEIDGASVEPEAGAGPVDYARWLVHDTQKPRPARPGTILPRAWSAGCFVMSPDDLEAFGQILDAYKVRPGELIPGEVIED